MNTEGHWSGYTVEHGGGVEAGWVELAGCLNPEPWFAVPLDDHVFDVAVRMATDRPPWEGGSNLSWSPARTPPAMFDPALFGGAPVWTGYPALLCRATRLAVDEWATGTAPLRLDAPAVVGSLTSLVGEDQIGVVSSAGATWIERVLHRKPSDEVVVPWVVAKARAMHIHVVQLCGPDPSPQRLQAEADLYRTLSSSYRPVSTPGQGQA